MTPELLQHQYEQATYWANRNPLTFRHAEIWYIAIHKSGYGVDTNPAKAILAAQESVQVTAKPGQLLIYQHDAEIAPTGFVTWPNGATPKLVGCTNTHQGYKRRKK